MKCLVIQEILGIPSKYKGILYTCNTDSPDTSQVVGLCRWGQLYTCTCLSSGKHCPTDFIPASVNMAGYSTTSDRCSAARSSLVHCPEGQMSKTNSKYVDVQKSNVNIDSTNSGKDMTSTKVKNAYSDYVGFTILVYNLVYNFWFLTLYHRITVFIATGNFRGRVVFVFFMVGFNMQRTFYFPFISTADKSDCFPQFYNLWSKISQKYENCRYMYALRV